jgi:hypothetical protein
MVLACRYVRQLLEAGSLQENGHAPDLAIDDLRPSHDLTRPFGSGATPKRHAAIASYSLTFRTFARRASMFNPSTSAENAIAA